MRMVSLLVTLLIVAWLVHTQLGGNKAPTEAATYRQAEQKAHKAVDQLEARAQQQADAMARLQAATPPETPPSEAAP